MKHLNKAKRFLELFVTAAVLAGCSKADTSSGSSKAQESQKETGESAQPAEEAAVVEGQDVNNGRPFNRNPVKYDERDDKYLNGVNATRFPISDTLLQSTLRIGMAHHLQSLKKKIPLPEKHSITKVCIDDFAFRKRQAYGTIMVDIDTHRVADLLASREVEDGAEWLRSYPNIRIVSRDGSVSYKSAIEQAGMDIQQVSDRFHLLKGLTDAAKNSYHACFIPVRQDM